MTPFNERPCPACSSMEHEFWAEIEPYRLCRCTNCGLIMTLLEDSWAPPAEYDDYGEYLIRDRSKIMALKYRLYYRRLNDLIRGTRGNRVVDIGAGAGYFVKHCQDLGCEAVGVEPSSKLRSFAQEQLGVKLVDSISELPDDFADVLVSQDVIEHVSAGDLDDHLHDVLRVLKPGGIFAGNTPNADSWNLRRYGMLDPAVHPPHHSSYFSSRALNEFLTRRGFAEIYDFSRGIKPSPKVDTRHAFVRPLLSASGALLWLAFARRSPYSGYQLHFAYEQIPSTV